MSEQRPVSLDLKPLSSLVTGTGGLGLSAYASKELGIDPLASLFLSLLVGIIAAALTAMVTGVIYLPPAVELLKQNRDDHKARADRAEATLESIRQSAGTLAEKTVESQSLLAAALTRSAESDAQLAKTMDRIANNVGKGP